MRHILLSLVLSMSIGCADKIYTVDASEDRPLDLVLIGEWRNDTTNSYFNFYPNGTFETNYTIGVGQWWIDNGVLVCQYLIGSNMKAKAHKRASYSIMAKSSRYRLSLAFMQPEIESGWQKFTLWRDM